MSNKTKALDRNRSMDTLKRILFCIARYKWGVILLLSLALITVALILCVPILTGRAVDQIVSTGHMNFSGLTAVLWKILGAIGLIAVAQWMMNRINDTITYKMVKDVRTRAFSHLETLPLSYIDSHPSGDIISRVVADIDQFSEDLLIGFTQLFTGMLTTMGTLLSMLSIHPVITLVVVLLTPISLSVVSFIAERTFVIFRHQSVAGGELTTLTDEMPGNMKMVQAPGYQKEAQRKFEEIDNRLVEYGLRTTFFSSITNPATRFVNSAMYAAVGITGTYAAIRGFVTVGQLTSFLSYANQYTKPSNEISGVVTEFQNVLASTACVFELIDEKAILANKPDAVELEQVDGRVELKHTDFSYTSDRRLIENLNLLVEPGWWVAIIGPTGCGKTTIINLLMRFCDINSGVIRVEGEDIRDVTRKSLRANYGIVLQETWLKSGTIRENIVYGKPDATEDEVIRVAKEAHTHGFIIRMSERYDTIIREDGGNLSQGRKQLLYIARVTLCLPPMLILGEATSSIDIRTEIRVQKAFTRMMEGCTSFIVARRLSTIREADMILVVCDGHIVEKGRHERLLERDGSCAGIYSSQFARTQPDIRSREVAGHGFGHRPLIFSRLPAPQT